jgi:type II secretory pathway pseudopilin PulG
MAALLVALAVMGVLLSVALPVWETAARREKEAELIFRGEQYARAVALFQQRFGGAFPPNVDALVTERVLRKKYLDPITGKDFEVITPASAIAGSPVPGGAAGLLAGAAGAQGAARTGGAGARQGGGAAVAGRGTAATGAGRGAFTPLTLRGGGAGPGQVGASAGVLGVRSTSTERSLRVYNGAETYDQWLFIGTQSSGVAGGGAEGADTPGIGPGGRGGADDGRGGRGGRGGRADGRGGRGGEGLGGLRQGGGGGRGGRGF